MRVLIFILGLVGIFVLCGVIFFILLYIFGTISEKIGDKINFDFDDIHPIFDFLGRQLILGILLSPIVLYIILFRRYYIENQIPFFVLSIIGILCVLATLASKFDELVFGKIMLDLDDPKYWVQLIIIIVLTVGSSFYMGNLIF
jgi:hypothetical protein